MIMATDQIGRPIIVRDPKAKEILFAVSEHRTYTKINPNSGVMLNDQGKDYTIH